jgi:hypothetical protein
MKYVFMKHRRHTLEHHHLFRCGREKSDSRILNRYLLPVQCEANQTKQEKDRVEKQGRETGSEGVNTATKHYTMNTCNRHPDYVGNA